MGRVTKVSHSFCPTTVFLWYCNRNMTKLDILTSVQPTLLLVCVQCLPDCPTSDHECTGVSHCLSCKTEDILLSSGVLLKMEVGICKGPWRRAWRYPAYLWSLRWVYGVKKPGGWYTAYTCVYPPIHHCCYPKKDGTTAVIFCFFFWFNPV